MSTLIGGGSVHPGRRAVLNLQSEHGVNVIGQDATGEAEHGGGRNRGAGSETGPPSPHRASGDRLPCWILLRRPSFPLRRLVFPAAVQPEILLRGGADE